MLQYIHRVLCSEERNSKEGGGGVCIWNKGSSSKLRVQVNYRYQNTQSHASDIQDQCSVHMVSLGNQYTNTIKVFH